MTTISLSAGIDFHGGRIMGNRIWRKANDNSPCSLHPAELLDFAAVMQRIHKEADCLTEDDQRMMRRLEFWTVCAIGSVSKKC